jgi:NADH:ubiquinone oxidoreductase subunit C
MADIDALHAKITERFASLDLQTKVAVGEITLLVPQDRLREVALILRDDPALHFNLLVDVCEIAAKFCKAIVTTSYTLKISMHCKYNCKTLRRLKLSNA